DPRLYAEIAILNPHVKAALASLQESSSRLLESIERGDVAAFERTFRQSAEYMGSFKEKALKSSSRMIEWLAGAGGPERLPEHFSRSARERRDEDGCTVAQRGDPGLQLRRDDRGLRIGRQRRAAKRDRRSR